MEQYTAIESKTAPSLATVERGSSWRFSALQSFDPIRLSEIGHAALLRRTDTKYLLGERELAWAIAGLTGHYRILEIGARRLHRYRTLYFDTETLALYRQHHSDWRNRYKVRERVYADSDLAFLEVKQKIDANTTVKSRMRTRSMSAQIAREAEPFVRAHYPYQIQELQPRLYNTFQRITLVSIQDVERVTVDVGLRLWWSGEDVSLDGIAIAEVKRDGPPNGSSFAHQMRTLGVRPTGFSKYCIGVSMLYPQIKHNRFKPLLYQIGKLLRKERTACQTYSYC